jgi:hypothetical protein
MEAASFFAENNLSHARIVDCKKDKAYSRKKAPTRVYEMLFC